MNFKKICAAFLVALVAVGITLAAPGGALAIKRGGTLTFMIPAADAPSLDAHRETTYATVHAVSGFYSLLVRIDPTDPKGEKIAGDLAKSWKVSKDQKTWTFKIHKGVKFHDGTSLTAKDVVATYNKLVFPPEGVLSARKGYFLMVESISAPKNDTVVFKLKFGSAAFLPAMAMPYNNIYSAAQLKKDIHWYEKNVNGSGPYKLSKFTPGGSISGIRNKNYFKKGLPYLDGFEATYVAKQAPQVTAIRSGRSVGVFRGMPPSVRDELVEKMGKDITIQEDTWNCALYVVPNSYRKPFDDPRVRRALSISLDRWGGSQYLSKIAIVRTVGGYLFPGHPLAWTEAEMVQHEGYGKDMDANRAKARQLLKEAGIPEGFKFVLHNRGVEQPYKYVGTWAIDQWRRIGLNVEQWTQPSTQFYKTLRSNPPGSDVSLDFNCQSIVNPTLDIAKYISWNKGGGSNNGKYVDSVLDDIFLAQMKETDGAKQKALMNKFQDRLVEQAWYIPTLWWSRIVPLNSKLKGWYITPSHYLNMQFETVWLDQ